MEEAFRRLFSLSLFYKIASDQNSNNDGMPETDSILSFENTYFNKVRLKKAPLT